MATIEPHSAPSTDFVDWLAEVIREVDGNHSLGAAALAEKIAERLTQAHYHRGATHCGGCGLTWLDDGLNPLGCPYCKSK